MKDTSFYLDKAKLKRFSTSYQPNTRTDCGAWRLRPAETSEKVRGPKVHFGAGGDMGGALSTVPDYTRLPDAAQQREFDGVRILSRNRRNHDGRPDRRDPDQ